jgi:hypothetical protein
MPKLSADSLAAEFEDAMQAEWVAVKGTSLSSAGEEDRRILFAAIARGLLKFLTDNRSDIETSANDGGEDHRHIVEWDYE